MKVVLKSQLSPEDLKRLLRFAQQCGADTFTVVSSATNPFEKVFKPYYIGTEKAELPVPPEDGRRFEKLHFWRFIPASLREIVRLYPEWVFQADVTWGFYRGTQLFLVICGNAAYLIDLVVHQWEALFRLGFRFGLERQTLAKGADGGAKNGIPSRVPFIRPTSLD